MLSKKSTFFPREVDAFYSAYERLGFHIGVQPFGAKAGNGHKPGDYKFVPMTAAEAVEYLGKVNLSVCPAAPFAFLDLDGIPLEFAVRVFGRGIWTHTTASGGAHVLVRVATSRLPLRNDAITTPMGCMDVKGCGTGYVIGPGSEVDGRRYTGQIGIMPTLTNAALDNFLKLTGGKLNDTPCRAELAPAKQIVVRQSEPHLVTSEHVDGAIKAIRAGLAGEYPSTELTCKGTGRKQNTYRDWGNMTWSIRIYGGEALKPVWEDESVRFLRLPHHGTNTYESTWRNTPHDFSPGLFAGTVNANARARGIASPLPFYRPKTILPPGINLAGVVDLGAIQ